MPTIDHVYSWYQLWYTGLESPAPDPLHPTTAGTYREQYYPLYTSLAESPECWNLEFQLIEIFADNFLIFANNFQIKTNKFFIGFDEHTKFARFLRNISELS